MHTMMAVSIEVLFDDTTLAVELSDGRALRAPLAWFRRLVAALPARRQRVRISSSRKAPHWDELDEDAGVCHPSVTWSTHGF
ncbi:DUF2442 domain-containing protein [Paraburkholderia phymatum]|uniref:DUF2442 domain-containing protein n=1 Tax=Paraburkholderia phymatum TaxID=148447 RepID=UPI003D17881A